MRLSAHHGKAVLARVVRCVPIQSGLFRIGAEFLQCRPYEPRRGDVPYDWTTRAKASAAAH